MKILAITISFLLLLSFFSSDAFAKTLPQSKSSSKAVAPKTASSGSSITVSPRLRKDKNALLISFSNLQNATAVSYTLIYQTNGQEEGAGGSVRPSDGNAANRELLFGTCSKNVCRYHTNIKNVRLEVTGQLKSGKTFTKRYRIRI